MAFDLRKLSTSSLPKFNRSEFGLFPIGEFAGKYDSKTDCARFGNTAQKLESNHGTWLGQDNTTKKEVKVRLGQLTGSRIAAYIIAGDISRATLFEGTIIEGKIECEAVALSINDPDGRQCWGTIEGDRMELFYGNNHVQEGTASLRFKKPEETNKRKKANKR